MKTRKLKTREFLCWLVMTAVFCAVSFGGCGGSSSNNFVSNNTQSQDVIPVVPDIPTSPDIAPVVPDIPTSPDIAPVVPDIPTSPDVAPVVPDIPTSPDVTGDDTTVVESTLNVNDTATASKVLSAVNAASGTEVASLPEEAVGAERTLDDVPASDLAAIPSDETPAVVLPVMTVARSAVYVWGVDLSSLTEGDYIFMHMMPDSSFTAAGFFAATESDSCVFLDDSGNKITRVPASKHVNAAAYMTAGVSCAPIITTKKTDSSSDTDTPVVPVVPDVPASPDVQPVVPDVPASPDAQPVVPDVPTSPDVQPVVPDAPTSPDVQPVVPDAPTSPDVQPVVPDAPTSPDVQPVVPDAPTSPDVTPDVPTPPTSDDKKPDASTSGDKKPGDGDVITEDEVITDDEVVTGESYSSTTALENALVINGSTSTYTNITVTKTGDASGQSENYDWYGTNAAILAKNGADVTISGSSTSISSNAVGGNAVFAYGGNSSMNTNNSGDGTKITISDATITTQSRNSGGIMVTGGGIIEASNLTITTSSGSSAAIRSDRGGGTITATGGTYTTSGVGSPAIYSTAAITGNDVTLTSNAAQVVVIEGGNSVTLTDSTLNANHSRLNGQDTTHQAVLIYQSQSGDASSGSSFFKMAGGSITNTQGDIFHVTNTTTTITLSESIAITNNDSSGYFLRASTDSWGSSGNNGGKVTLNADGQTIEGNMLVDSVSTLTLNMSNSSVFSGAINTSGQNGTVSVVIDSSSSWTLTGNSYITSLTNNGTIDRNGYTLYVNGAAYSN